MYSCHSCQCGVVTGEVSVGDPHDSRFDTNIQQDNKDKDGSRESPRSDKSKLTCCARASAAAISSLCPIHTPSFLISSSPWASFFETRLYVGLSVMNHQESIMSQCRISIDQRRV